MRKTFSLTVLALCTIAALGIAPAQAVIIASPPAGEATGFVLPQLIVPKGQTATFLNADLVSHNVESVKKKASGKPLFVSGYPGPGETADITGVSSLAAGSYAFFCAIHKDTMVGTLTVI